MSILETPPKSAIEKILSISRVRRTSCSTLDLLADIEQKIETMAMMIYNQMRIWLVRVARRLKFQVTKGDRNGSATHSITRKAQYSERNS